MRFLADESLEAPIVARLREEGHDLEAIAETQAGADDSGILLRAARLRRILLTNDKDFATGPATGEWSRMNEWPCYADDDLWPQATPVEGTDYAGDAVFAGGTPGT